MVCLKGIFYLTRYSVMLVRTDILFSVSKWLPLTQRGFSGDTIHIVKGRLLCLTRAVVARPAFSSAQVQASESTMLSRTLSDQQEQKVLIQDKK